MRRIYYDLYYGYVGVGESGEQEVDDDMTDSQIDTMVHEMALEGAQSWEGDERLGWHSDMTDEEYEQETEYFYENVGGSWRWAEEDE